MNVNQIFDEMIKRTEQLEKMINETIEGNTGNNKYVYNTLDRGFMQKELAVLEKTIEFIDNQLA